MTELIKILLADDHVVVRSGIRQFLENADDLLVIAEVSDGEAAQSAIRELQPDVAILDIQMPKMTGIEVARWASKEYPQIGILILTAYDDAPYVTAVLQAGANGFVLKTAAPDEIIQAVRDVYEGKSVLDSSVAHTMIAQLSKERNAGYFEKLSGREMGVLTLTAKGYTNKAIGMQLGISSRTVQGHLAHIFNKLQASSRTEAVMRAVSLGWMPSDILKM